MRTPIPASLDGWHAAADACAELALAGGKDTRWSLATLLRSPLLHSEASRKRALELRDGGFEGIGRGGGDFPMRPISIEATESPATQAPSKRPRWTKPP